MSPASFFALPRFVSSAGGAWRRVGVSASILVTGALTGLAPQHAKAVSFWDGGSGRWDYSTPDWGGNAWNFGDDASFGGTPGTVTAENVGVGSLEFTSDGYVIDGALTLIGSATIVPSLVGSSLISARLEGSVGLSVVGSGEGNIFLTGRNTYTGITSIAGATVTVSDLSADEGESSLGNDPSAIRLGNGGIGGTIVYEGYDDTITRGLWIGAGGEGRFENPYAVMLTFSTGYIQVDGFFHLATNGHVVLGSALQGPGSFSKTGLGDLTMNADVSLNSIVVAAESGATTFLGASSIVAYQQQIYTGPVALTADVGLTVLNPEGQLVFDGSLDGDHALTTESLFVSFHGPVGGTTPLASIALTGGANTYISGGVMTTSGAQTYSGPIQLGADTTFTGTSLALASLNGGDFALTVNASGASSAGNLSALASLTQAGTGTLTLAGANTYSGPTTVTAGNLHFAATSALYDATPAAWTATNLVVAGGATATFSVGGSGEFTAAHLDTLLTLGTATGGFADGSFIGLDTTHAAGGVFTYAGNIANPNGGANALGLTKLGTGSLLLTGVNTYTGPTRVDGGTLQLGSPTALSPGTTLLVAPGAQFDANGYQLTLPALPGRGEFNVGTAGLILAPAGTDTITVAHTFSGPGGLAIGVPLAGGSSGGTVVLSSVQTYTGPTAVHQGTLELAPGASLPENTSVYVGQQTLLRLGGTDNTISRLEGDGEVEIGGGNLEIVQAGNTTFAGTFSGTGGTLTMSGTGQQTWTGTHPFPGAARIMAMKLNLSGTMPQALIEVSDFGTLSGSGSAREIRLLARGRLGPGNSPGMFSTDSATFASDGVYEWEINAAGPGTSAGTAWDLLSISGTLEITASAEAPFIIDLRSLAPDNTAGALTGLVPGQIYTWELALASGGINGFDPTRFALNTSAFEAANTSVGGTFALQLGSAGGGANTSLDLVFTSTSAIPEPGTYAALAGSAVLALAVLRRRAPRRAPPHSRARSS